MATYYLDVKPIGGGSGRSAVGAASYRSGEKMHNELDGRTHDYSRRRGAADAAAYRSGSDINGHDFTGKSGIVYNEIMLPDHAPKKYFTRAILWNAAVKAERNRNARTGREIVVSLPNELALDKQIKLVRNYVRRNFVTAGMCADFSIHAGHIHSRKGEKYPFEGSTKRKNNPHAHIQLTVRPINPDGTWGAKSKKEYILDRNGNKIKLPSGNWKSRKMDATDWDKTETLLKWREDWAVTVNKVFERLGMKERIDHRTLEAQGIDREPTRPMGHKAWNLEKKGVKTNVGNRNREIMARNQARHAQKLKEGCTAISEKIAALTERDMEANSEIMAVQHRAAKILQRANEIQDLSNRITQQRNTQLERALKQAENTFRQMYNITPEQAESEMQRLADRRWALERSREKLRENILALDEEREAYAREHQRLAPPEERSTRSKLASLREDERRRVRKHDRGGFSR